MKIDIKDVRFGNYYLRHGEPYMVTYDFLDDMYNIYDSGDGGDISGQLSPMPMSEFMALELGFKKMDYNNDEGEFTDYRYYLGNYTFIEMYEDWSVSICRVFKQFEDSVPISGRGLFVHEVQDLIRALTISDTKAI